LTKLHPRVIDDDADELPAESGSFFNFFELESDPFDVSTDELASCSHRLILYVQIGMLIANEIFPEATDYFLGKIGGEDLDSDEEDSDDEAEEIDLEKPKTKKQKQG
jgi:template-activating factor I